MGESFPALTGRALGNSALTGRASCTRKIVSGCRSSMAGKVGKGDRVRVYPYREPTREQSPMPYIAAERRRAITGGSLPKDAGELNYAITALVDRFLKDKNGFRYADLNEAIGAIECAKFELYRRVAAPYEDQKIVEAGDVYTSIEPT